MEQTLVNTAVNTATLNLFEYNELRDFKKEIEKGNTYHTSNYYQGMGLYQYQNQFISTDEAVKKIAEENASLLKEIQVLKDKDKPKGKTIEEVKKMSIWQFRKWRKQ